MVSWITRPLFLEQRRLRGLEEQARAARATQASPRAERQRREHGRVQKSSEQERRCRHMEDGSGAAQRRAHLEGQERKHQHDRTAERVRGQEERAAEEVRGELGLALGCGGLCGASLGWTRLRADSTMRARPAAAVSPPHAQPLPVIGPPMWAHDFRGHAPLTGSGRRRATRPAPRAPPP